MNTRQFYETIFENDPVNIIKEIDRRRNIFLNEQQENKEENKYRVINQDVYFTGTQKEQEFVSSYFNDRFCIVSQASRPFPCSLFPNNKYIFHFKFH